MTSVVLLDVFFLQNLHFTLVLVIHWYQHYQYRSRYCAHVLVLPEMSIAKKENYAIITNVTWEGESVLNWN